ncbi:hypothetical protein FRC10_006297 [Ceratobasidium sp. 414]|nr:hypothetical protein FRC10_006297 [Ceratobasidium sp. 414]
MTSPESDSWSIISRHEQQLDQTRKTQEMYYEASTSVANLSSMRRLGTSRTHYQMEEPAPGTSLPPPPPLVQSTYVSSPIPVPAAGSSRRASKKPPPTAFPKTEENEKVEREPAKGNSIGRRIRTSLLGGKNPFLSNKKDKQEPAIVIPATQSPEPDAVLVPHAVDAESDVAQAPPVKPPRPYQPPPVTAYTHPSHSSQSQLYPRSSSTTTLGQSSRGTSTPELLQFGKSKLSHIETIGNRLIAAVATPDPPPPKPREVPIVELPSSRVDARSSDPALGGKSIISVPAVYGPTNSGSAQTEIRPLPQLPTSRQPAAPPSTSRSYQAASAALGVMVNPLPTPPAAHVPASAPMPALERAQPPPTTSTRSYHRDLPTPHATASSPPVVRNPTSSDRTSRASRTSQGTTATTPSFSSSSRTHASASDTPVPPEGMERIAWATAPSRSSHPSSGRHRSASVDRMQVTPNEEWNDSMAQLRLGQQHQQQQPQTGYHVQIISNTRNAAPPTNEATRPPVSKLQRQATVPASAPPAVVSYVYYDREPPLISSSSRLSDLKEDYRNPGSERSDIIRRKINYLRFELGYTGLRRSRGDGNCFYRSFAFAYLAQIYFADDRPVAVVTALENLETAQNYVELAIPGHPLSRQVFLFLQGLIRGMELRTTDQKTLLKIFQNRQESDDIVEYVRLITSAYIRLTPEIHGSVFHPDDPTVVISPFDFCAVYVEQLGQDADHIQISALSRALNVTVYIYRLDEKVDGKAPNEQDIPAHCTRFIPPGS